MRAARILIVDDEPAAAEIVARYAALKGHRAEIAGSAEAAAAALGSERYDFVLLDVILPGLTGLQALAVLRGLTSAPIHVMSGLNDEDTRKDALLLGAGGFFGKPLDLPAILAAVEALPGR